VDVAWDGCRFGGLWGGVRCVGEKKSHVEIVIQVENEIFLFVDANAGNFDLQI